MYQISGNSQIVIETFFNNSSWNLFCRQYITVIETGYEIDKIQPGDLVFSKDEVSGKVGYKPVARTFVRRERYGEIPTNLEYTKAAMDSLRAAGLDKAQALEAIRAATRQRLDYGLLGVPKIPRKIYQSK